MKITCCWARRSLAELIRLIADDPDLRGIELHAPEGIEVRLFDREMAGLMKRAGFQRLYFPLETVNAKMQRDWQRTHTNMDKFFFALENAIAAGYRTRCQDINCFVLFGLPDEDLQAVYEPQYSLQVALVRSFLCCSLLCRTRRCLSSTNRIWIPRVSICTT